MNDRLVRLRWHRMVAAGHASRLIDTMRAHCRFPPAALLEAIVEAVRDFSPGEQQDDITLVVARCTA